MTVAMDNSFRGWSSNANTGSLCLEDKYEIIKDIGDGSFGSVVLARTRSAGAHLVRRNTLVCRSSNVDMIRLGLTEPCRLPSRQ